MRLVTQELKNALETGVRFPDYRLLAYDSKVDSMSEIVRGVAGQTPIDITEYVQGDIAWTPTQMSFTLSDPSGVFHPDTGAWGLYLSDGAVIRLIEGDQRVPTDQWVITFTGSIKGQSSWEAGPRGKMVVSKVTVFGREATQAYKRRKITTGQYTNGTDISIMLHDVAETFMGITPEENLIPVPCGRVFMHTVNQLSQVAPWEGIRVLAEVTSCVPCFNGEGRLRWYDKNMVRTPDRYLPDYITVHKIEAPQQAQDVYNRVVVKFLDCFLAKVPGDEQCLGTANITTGFFTFEEKLECWWSEDRRQRAENTWCKVIKGINDNLLPIGNDPGTDPSMYQQLDEYHGRITIEISIWVPILAGVLLIDYLLAAAIPDGVATGGFLFSAGQTIPYGRIIQAIDMIGILLIMMSLGSAQYEIWGTPYDWCYPMKQAIAVEDGLNYWDEVEMVIENDFIGSMDQAEAVSITELIYQKSLGRYPRKISIDDDLALEIGDILQIPDGRRFFCLNMRKSISRGKLPILEIDGFKVLTA